jgi:hypothetical protein
MSNPQIAKIEKDLRNVVVVINTVDKLKLEVDKIVRRSYPQWIRLFVFILGNTRNIKRIKDSLWNFAIMISTF